MGVLGRFPGPELYEDDDASTKDEPDPRNNATDADRGDQK